MENRHARKYFREGRPMCGNANSRLAAAIYSAQLHFLRFEWAYTFSQSSSSSSSAEAACEIRSLACFVDLGLDASSSVGECTSGIVPLYMHRKEKTGMRAFAIENPPVLLIRSRIDP